MLQGSKNGTITPTLQYHSIYQYGAYIVLSLVSTRFSSSGRRPLAANGDNPTDICLREGTDQRDIATLFSSWSRPVLLYKFKRFLQPWSFHVMVPVEDMVNLLAVVKDMVPSRPTEMYRHIWLKGLQLLCPCLGMFPRHLVYVSFNLSNVQWRHIPLHLPVNGKAELGADWVLFQG